jgi:hypothetical protein
MIYHESACSPSSGPLKSARSDLPALLLTYQPLIIFDLGRLGTMNGSRSATHPALFAVAEFLAIDVQNWKAAVEAANKYKSAQKTN